MSNGEFIVWKGTWRHRVLDKLEEKEALDWRTLRKECKLSPHALNTALGGLQRSQIIKKEKKEGITVYKICGEYTIKSQNEEEIVSEEVEEEESIERLLSRVELTEQEIPLTIEPIAEDVLNSKFSILTSEAKDNIIVVSPFLDDNKYTRKLLKIASERDVLIVTRPLEAVYWNKNEHEQMLSKFEKNAK